MKGIFFVVAAALLAGPQISRAQDAAVEERLNRLSAQIQDLNEAKEAQKKRIDELEKLARDLQDQQNKPNANYAAHDDLKQLAAKLQEIDKKRQEDNELIVKRIESLGKTLTSTPAKLSPAPKSVPVATDTAPQANENGFPYTIQSGDTLLAIVQAYRDKNIKVTIDQILKANPGLKPEKMHVGQKIFIPAPQ